MLLQHVAVSFITKVFQGEETMNSFCRYAAPDDKYIIIFVYDYFYLVSWSYWN